MSADAGHVLVARMGDVREKARTHIPLAVITGNGQLRLAPKSAFPHWNLQRTRIEYPWVVGIRSTQQPPDDWTLYAANVLTGRHIILDHGNGVGANVTRQYPDFALNRGRVVWNDAAFPAGQNTGGIQTRYSRNRLDLYNLNTGKKSIIASSTSGSILYMEPTLWDNSLVWVQAEESLGKNINPLYDLMLTHLGSHTITNLTQNTHHPYTGVSVEPSLWQHYLLFKQSGNPFDVGDIVIWDLSKGLRIRPKLGGILLEAPAGEMPLWDNGVAYWGSSGQATSAVYIPGTGKVWTFQNPKHMSDPHYYKYTWQVTGWQDTGTLVVMRALHNTLGDKTYFVWHFPPAKGWLRR